MFQADRPRLLTALSSLSLFIITASLLGFATPALAAPDDNGFVEPSELADLNEPLEIGPSSSDPVLEHLQQRLRTLEAEEKKAAAELEALRAEEERLKNENQELVSTERETELAGSSPPGLGILGDERISELTSRLFALIEGNAGALIVVLAGLAALISAAFGAYRAAVSLLLVTVGAFILRALVEIFFNYTGA